VQHTKLFLRFLFSGGLFTGLDFILFYSLLNYISHELAYIIAYAICIILRYFFDKAFTFKTKQHSFKQLTRYIIVNSVVLVLGFISFQLASLFIELLPAKLASIPVTLVSGFILTRLLVFKKNVS
jgi:putative flippase GtrA